MKLMLSWLLIALLATSLVTFSKQSQSAATYVSDNLTAFMHTGPSREYRIRGNVVSGTLVRVVGRSESGEFTEVVNENGLQGWVETQYLQQQKSNRELLPEVQQALEDTQALILPLEQKVAELTSALELQQKDSGEQAQTLGLANERIAELEQKLATKELDIQIRWLINGGGLAMGSLILGILITYLPKRRKRSSGWAD